MFLKIRIFFFKLSPDQSTIEQTDNLALVHVFVFIIICLTWLHSREVVLVLSLVAALYSSGLIDWHGVLHHHDVLGATRVV